MYRFIIRLLLFVVLCGPIFGISLAQEGGNSNAATPQGSTGWLSFFTDNRSEKFAQLRLRRLDLGQRLETLQAELAELNEKAAQFSRNPVVRPNQYDDYYSSSTEELQTKKRRMEFERETFRKNLGADQARMEAELKRLQAIDPPNAEQSERIESLKRNIEEMPQHLARYEDQYTFDSGELDRQIAAAEQDMADRLKEIEEIRKAAEEEQRAFEQAVSTNAKAIVDKRAEIARLANEMDKVDAEIVGLIEVTDRDSWFKTGISFLFALLVGGVIYGFYRAISGKAEVINVIFSNDSGIQFVTIFSIVIAVILFGIIGVLEGKELSALLGGLSGYILGRSSAQPVGTKDSAVQPPPRKPSDPPPPPPPPPAPVAPAPVAPAPAV